MLKQKIKNKKRVSVAKYPLNSEAYSVSDEGENRRGLYANHYKIPNQN